MMHEKPVLVVIAGPTAVGKTAVSVRLAKDLNTSIINADSRQVFREMQIGTAMPDLKEQEGVNHYFLGHRSVVDGYNASQYENEVLGFLNTWFPGNRKIIMVGGSGLYIDAVRSGIDDLPAIDPEVRKKVRKHYEKSGIEEIRKELKEKDPHYFENVDIHNPRRMLKALEVFEMTGKPYSSYLTGQPRERNFRTIMIGLDRPRQELHERINQRVDEMMSRGLVEEARSLVPLRNHNALNTVGYKELFDFFDQKCTLEEAVEKVKAHSRQYARRQLTWFRRYQDIRWFHPSDYSSILRFVISNM